MGAACAFESPFCTAAAKEKYICKKRKSGRRAPALPVSSSHDLQNETIYCNKNIFIQMWVSAEIRGRSHRFEYVTTITRIEMNGSFLWLLRLCLRFLSISVYSICVSLLVLNSPVLNKQKTNRCSIPNVTSSSIHTLRLKSIRMFGIADKLFVNDSYDSVWQRAYWCNANSLR